MELLILLYLLALTGYVIYLRLKKVPSIEREAEEKISETKEETLCAIKEAESTLMQAVLFCRTATEKTATVYSSLSTQQMCSPQRSRNPPLIFSLELSVTSNAPARSRDSLRRTPLRVPPLWTNSIPALPTSLAMTPMQP